MVAPSLNRWQGLYRVVHIALRHSIFVKRVRHSLDASSIRQYIEVLIAVSLFDRMLDVSIEEFVVAASLAEPWLNPVIEMVGCKVQNYRCSNPNWILQEVPPCEPV